MSALEVVVGILTGAESSHLFYGRLPSKMTTRKFADERDIKVNLEAIGESLFIGIILAIVVAYFMKSSVVFIIAMIIMVMLTILYLNDIYKWW